MTLSPVHLTRASVSVVVAPDDDGQPVLLHWGAPLGELSPEQLAAFAAARRPGIPQSAFDHPRLTGLVPEAARGFTGTPALAGHHGDGAGYPRLTGWTARGSDASLQLSGSDPETGWAVTVDLELTEQGLLRRRTTVRNAGDTELRLASVLDSLPVGAHATELLDLTGRWSRERTPQRHPWVQGTHRRDVRHGRPGHDATLLLVAGTPGFGFGHGEVWGVHVAWSGNHTTYAERTPEGDCRLGGGELLDPGEVVLAPGQSYASPWLLGSWSDSGLDAMSHRLHGWLRSRSPRTRTPRPTVVNTWEAVYMEHDLARLTALADRAAKEGLERFVLDDGWFRGRRDDTRGLGDWTVDPDVWPDGLHPLVDHVRGLGLQFGLWVEPEMVNEDSDLAREHPDWILRGRASRLPDPWRHQQVLDLQQPGAYAHVRDALLALLAEYDIAFVKWDHNRDLCDALHDGRPAAHGQTLALYRLLDELRAAHPGLEIETCASGGGRVDAEILARTDRIWPSDTLDALERQHLQRWTSLLVPPELIGSHVGGPVAHTTGRSHRLGFRAATALLYSFGVEWDLTGLDSMQRHALRGWVDLHRRIRPLIPTATLVHGDHPDPALLLTGLVTPDRREAWYVVATVGSPDTQHLAPLRLPGLDESLDYRVTEETATLDQHGLDLATWWAADGGLVVPGRALGHAGVSLPVTPPDVARVLHAEVTQ